MAKVGRPCTLCTSVDAARVDAELAAGASVVTVARDFRFSESAVYRHRARHLSASLLREARATASTSAGDLIARLAEVMDDLSAARSASLMAGNASGVVRAAAAEAQAIATLLDRLGVDDLETAREIRAAEALAAALGDAVYADPDAAAPIVAGLRRRHEDETADAVERLADRARAARSTTSPTTL